MKKTKTKTSRKTNKTNKQLEAEKKNRTNKQILDTFVCRYTRAILSSGNQSLHFLFLS